MYLGDSVSAQSAINFLYIKVSYSAAAADVKSTTGQRFCAQLHKIHTFKKFRYYVVYNQYNVHGFRIIYFI